MSSQHMKTIVNKFVIMRIPHIPVSEIINFLCIYHKKIHYTLPGTWFTMSIGFASHEVMFSLGQRHHILKLIGGFSTCAGCPAAPRIHPDAVYSGAIVTMHNNLPSPIISVMNNCSSTVLNILS